MWVLTIDGNLVNLADAQHIHIQQTEGSGSYSVLAEFAGGHSVSLGKVGSQERAQHLYNVLGSRLGAINLMQADREGGR
jgi:hypothetical protein